MSGTAQLLREPCAECGDVGTGTTRPVPLDERMKAYEHVHRSFLARRTWTIIRIDGKTFHTFTRGLRRPYDPGLLEAMAATMRELCSKIEGAQLGYCQSDEISLLLTDFANESTQPWFGGSLQKVVSVSASLATACFNLNFAHPVHDVPATFDSRAFTIDDPVEVANYFVWRQQDCRRNAVSMIGQAHFSPRELHGVSTVDLETKLWTERGVAVVGFPTSFRFGQVCERVTVTKPIEYIDRRSGETIVVDATDRRVWETQPAPWFDAKPSGWLAERIPRR